MAGRVSTKWDARKALKQLYAPPRTEFEFIKIPPLTYFMINGTRGPDGPEYAPAVEALYTASYTLKFMSKAAGADYVVPPLEGLWWADDYADFTTRNKANWLWTMMILIPPFVEPAMAAAQAKKGIEALSRLRVAELREGLSAQILHIGSYEDETPVLHRLHHELLPARGLAESDEHHESTLAIHARPRRKG